MIKSIARRSARVARVINSAVSSRSRERHGHRMVSNASLARHGVSSTDVPVAED